MLAIITQARLKVSYIYFLQGLQNTALYPHPDMGSIPFSCY